MTTLRGSIRGDSTASPCVIGSTSRSAPGNLALLLGALFRLSTYCDDPERMSAGAALQQLKLALAGNVWYLDGGWQTLVDGLRDRAAASGAEFRTRARADAVNSDGEA